MNKKHPDSVHRILHAYAHQLTNGNPRLANKLLNDTRLRLIERATAYPPTLIDFTTWAKIVMKTTFHQTIKNADLLELHHLAYHDTLNPMLPTRDKEYTLREQIQMMTHLTPHQAAAATLRLNGYNPDNIATKMNTDIEHVTQLLAQARHTLGHVWDS